MLGVGSVYCVTTIIVHCVNSIVLDLVFDLVSHVSDYLHIMDSCVHTHVLSRLLRCDSEDFIVYPAVHIIHMYIVHVDMYVYT